MYSTVMGYGTEQVSSNKKDYLYKIGQSFSCVSSGALALPVTRNPAITNPALCLTYSDSHPLHLFY